VRYEQISAVCVRVKSIIFDWGGGGIVSLLKFRPMAFVKKLPSKEVGTA
jgi:hypothetical protein